MGIVLFATLFLLCLKIKAVTEKKISHPRLQARKCHVLGSGKFKLIVLDMKYMRFMK